VFGATTAAGEDRLVVVRPGMPGERQRRAAARVVARPSLATHQALALARPWSVGAAPRVPPFPLTAIRAAAAITTVLVAIELAVGVPGSPAIVWSVVVVLALVLAGLTWFGRLGSAGVEVEQAARVVDGPVLDVARAAAAGDGPSIERLAALRDAFWSAPIDPPPTVPSGGATRPDGDEPWRVRPLDGERLWATNDLGDAVYAPGVLGVPGPRGTGLLVTPPDGVRGWRRLLLLQLTGGGRLLETPDRTALCFAMAPPESPGARVVFWTGFVLGATVNVAVAVAVGLAVPEHPVAWGLGAGVAFLAVASWPTYAATVAVARRACRTTELASPALLDRCEELRAAFDAEGPSGARVAASHRGVWEAVAHGATSPVPFGPV
jgi:hypothetical protein